MAVAADVIFQPLLPPSWCCPGCPTLVKGCSDMTVIAQNGQETPSTSLLKKTNMEEQEPNSYLWSWRGKFRVAYFQKYGVWRLRGMNEDGWVFNNTQQDERGSLTDWLHLPEVGLSSQVFGKQCSRLKKQKPALGFGILWCSCFLVGPLRQPKESVQVKRALERPGMKLTWAAESWKVETLFLKIQKGNFPLSMHFFLIPSFCYII